MKEYYFGENSVVLNFNKILCDSEAKILSSKPFYLLLERFINGLKAENRLQYTWLFKEKVSKIVDIYTALLVWSYDDVASDKEFFIKESNRNSFYKFTEEFYDYWRSIERYGFFNQIKPFDELVSSQRLINSSTAFTQLVLKLYRIVTQKIGGKNFNMLRQLPAGTNANLMLVANKWTTSPLYKDLPNQTFISSLLLRPPLMIYSKSNTRTGIFQPIDENPITKFTLDKEDWIVYPLLVGKYLAYVYTHREYIKYAVSLGSLFETVPYEKFKDRKPDLIYFYGTDNEAYDGVYYYDEKEDIHVATVTLNPKNDYFGYAKKMLLTLHNVRAMNEGLLPIHGAMVEIRLNNGDLKNIVLIGDSGAGKSESIEALRAVGKKLINEISIIYDDMGIIFEEKGKVKSSGTEIGAFVRLDDLDSGYAFHQIDRAVFLNPHKVNSRVILPASTYAFISAHHRVDYVLYANNYDETKTGVELFDSLATAIDTFEKGYRKAKGTTSEVGMTESYFANPFGPVQHQEQAKQLIYHYFEKMFNDKIGIGTLYTQLAVKGMEQKGPKAAALSLLEFITK